MILVDAELVNADHGEYILSFEKRTLLHWLTGGRWGHVKVIRFRGRCTVWYSYPAGVRVGTLEESWLSDIWTKLQWEKDGDRSKS